MEIKLTKDTTINDLKYQFSSRFPFLRLEFFKHKHRVGQSSLKDQKLNDRFLLKEVNPGLKEGVINLSPSTTVADLEQLFQKQFGLPVQVFRKANYQWVETTYTDILTLEKQNEMGAELSKVLHKTASI
ncbi:MAG: hypothetical protein H0V91_06245 [Flavisolibacter sp.]|nr:hypothetical protein [Flavisolibacter sp.]